ncbi:hypothetical protein [Microterricola viridarii]|uniref:DUF4760 domain-containing protein n=1 Tax=Microterricola viridarii TaxID=412690 RepID=A0A1H1SCT2_9MICO|nr:hypothetical protein [Microterricola viridarii]SDS45777.1 hypothetical protein SAMN04489834_1516 [Microterricola viridarii]
MSWIDPEAAAQFVKSVAPVVAGGLVALAGTITLFWLQQRAERRAREAQRVEAAFEKFMSFCAYVAQRLSIDEQRPKFSRWEVYDMGWRFTWALPHRDRAVGEWAMRIVVGTVEGFSEGVNDLDNYREKLKWAEENMNLAITFLDRWKQGKVKRKWFSNQLRGFESIDPPLPHRKPADEMPAQGTY